MNVNLQTMKISQIAGIVAVVFVILALFAGVPLWIAVLICGVGLIFQ